MKWIVIDTFDEKNKYMIVKDTDINLVSPIRIGKQILNVNGTTSEGNIIGEFTTLYNAIAEVEEYLEKGE